MASTDAKHKNPQNVPGDKKDVPNSSPAPKRNLRERVVAFFEANAPNEFQPKFVSLKLKAPYEAVKKCIQREVDNPKSKLVRTREGWYRVARTPEQLASVSGAKRLGIHGIQIQGKCPDEGIRYYLHQNSPFKDNNHGKYSFEFNGRPVTVDVYRRSPTVVVWLKATKNPLDFQEFNQFAYWLFGWAQGKIFEHTWLVKMWGWSMDFVNMNMTKSGYKQMTLQAFRNAWFQMYQKQTDLLRVEVHITPRDLVLQDVMRIFAEMRSVAEGESYRPPSEDRGDFAYQ
jgi:hypothetical protein